MKTFERLTPNAAVTSAPWFIMKLNRLLLISSLVAQGATSTFSQDAATDIEALKRQIQELDQKVRILERKQEIDEEAATEKTKQASSVSLGANGLSFRSADSNFVFKLRGYLQADSRIYFDDHSAGNLNDTFLIRRARPILEGTVYDKYDFRLMLDFASGINSTAANNGFLQDGYINARFLPQFQVQAGKFKEPVGLERLQSGRNMLFVERGYPTQLVPNRDVGLQIQGDLWASRLRYEVGVFNGVADGGSGDMETADDDKDIAARLFTTPFKNSRIEALRGLGVGIAGTIGNQEGALRNYVSPGQQRFFSYRSGAGTAAAPNVVADGEHWRITPQGYYYYGPFGLFGEYVISEQQVRLDAGGPSFTQARNTAWQVAASYVLTGEENAWRGIVPQKPFNPGNGGWGAWEIAARYGELHVDDALFPLYASPAASARSARSWGIGLNWYLNQNVKINFNYEQTDFNGGTSDFLQKGEKVFFTRAQISF
jgi:phosphate-selective porin OprO and OprP